LSHRPSTQEARRGLRRWSRSEHPNPPPAAVWSEAAVVGGRWPHCTPRGGPRQSAPRCEASDGTLCSRPSSVAAARQTQQQCLFQGPGAPLAGLATAAVAEPVSVAGAVVIRAVPRHGKRHHPLVARCGVASRQ
jgi:hypothetical protein